MSIKSRLDTLGAQIPDPALECCIDIKRGLAYGRAVYERLEVGPMSADGPPEFLPVCTKHDAPCAEGCLYAASVWRNIAELEHLRDLSVEMFQ